MTKAEKSLWRALRSRQIDDRKFDCQKLRYIAESFSRELRLISKVDGGSRDGVSLQEAQGSRCLQREGYWVLPFWDCDALEDFAAVHAKLVQGVGLSHPHPTLPHHARKPYKWGGL